MRLTPELIVRAYAGGVFPMAESADDPEIHWFEPRLRGGLPPDGFHVSRSLRRSRRRGGFRFSCDTDFDGVLAACAARPVTWINDEIAGVVRALHARGMAHSIEVRDEAGALAGGLYGLARGGAFFAESMVSLVTDGSKLALAELIARLRRGGFSLVDTQYMTPHLQSLGGIEMPRHRYRAALQAALEAGADHSAAFAPVHPAATDGAFWS